MKKPTLKSAKVKAWKAFSLWVRLSRVDDQGYLYCVTCMTKKHYKEMQAGHFLPGRRNAVLFSEDGVHPQCYGCNIGKGGAWPEYYTYMKKMYGLEFIDELMIKSHAVVKYTLQDYLDIAADYKQRLDELHPI